MLRLLELAKEKIRSRLKSGLPEVSGRKPPKEAVYTVYVTPFGPVFKDNNGVLLPFATRKHVFHDLAPLFYIKGAQEVFLSAKSKYEGKYLVTGIVTVNGKRFPFKATADFEAIVLDLVRVTGANISLKNPSTVIEYGGWRIYLKMPSIAGGEWELEAAKLLPPPSLASYGVLIAARILTLGLTRIATLIIGEPGAGKTTLLNSLLIEELRLFPLLRTVIVETVPELFVPLNLRRYVSRHVAKDGDIGRVLKNAIRYSRPDVLFVGEIRAGDIDFVEAGRSGTPTISTMHSPNAMLALHAIAMHARARLGPTVSLGDIADYIKCFIEVRKVHADAIKRGVIAGIALSDGKRLRYIYRRGRFCPDSEFLDLLSSYDTVIALSIEALYDHIRHSISVLNERGEVSALKPF